MGMSAGDEARIRRELASHDCRVFYEIQSAWLRELFGELTELRKAVADYHCRSIKKGNEGET